MLLRGKTILVTGVLTSTSLAFRVAELALAEGAQIVLSSFGRHYPLAERMAQRLPSQPVVLELDVTSPADLDQLHNRLTTAGVAELDGVVHSIASADPTLLGGELMAADWSQVATMLETSAYSYAALAKAVLPLMSEGSSLVGITFDSRIAWPTYNWMGVGKAALESINRYLARDLGSRQIRANLVAAGPIRTRAASAIPGFSKLAEEWQQRAPLTWDIDDATAVAKAVLALLSDWFPATTGEIIHVDGGAHAVGPLDGPAGV